MGHAVTSGKFVDISERNTNFGILCNLLPAPSKNQHQAQVQREMTERLGQGAELILPIHRRHRDWKFCGATC